MPPSLCQCPLYICPSKPVTFHSSLIPHIFIVMQPSEPYFSHRLPPIRNLLRIHWYSFCDTFTAHHRTPKTRPNLPKSKPKPLPIHLPPDQKPLTLQLPKPPIHVSPTSFPVYQIAAARALASLRSADLWAKSPVWAPAMVGLEG